jgi:hypothetical protein
MMAGRSIATAVRILTGMSPSMSSRTRETRKVIATTVESANLFLRNGITKPSVNWVAPLALSTGFEKPYVPKNSSYCCINTIFVDLEKTARRRRSSRMIDDAIFIQSLVSLAKSR